MRVLRNNKPTIEHDSVVIYDIISDLNKKILNKPELRFIEVSAYVMDNDIRPEYGRKREYVGDVYIDQLTDKEHLTTEIIKKKVKDVNDYLLKHVSVVAMGFFITTNDLFNGWVYVDIVLSSYREIPDFQRL